MYELGIFGGTFSPVHNGHVLAAKSFLCALELDKLLVMPTAVPPHKEMHGGASPDDRLKMLRMAFEDDEDYKNGRIDISDWEISNGGKSYTYRTLEHFRGEGVRLTLICGSDMFLTLEQWKNYRDIFSYARIAYTIRERENAELEAACRDAAERYRRLYAADIVYVDMEPIEISSTEVRAALSGEGDASRFLCDGVLEYIKSNDMYKGADKNEA